MAKYLLRKTDGDTFPWTETLAAMPDMVEIDETQLAEANEKVRQRDADRHQATVTGLASPQAEPPAPPLVVPAFPEAQPGVAPPVVSETTYEPKHRKSKSEAEPEAEQAPAGEGEGEDEYLKLPDTKHKKPMTREEQIKATLAKEAIDKAPPLPPLPKHNR